VIDDLRLIDDPDPILNHLREIGVVSVLSAPITAAGRLSGRLTFGAEEANTLTAEHRAIAGEVAAQLSIAVQHHHLQEQQRLHAIELEQRVAQRTTELQAANQELESFSYSISHDLRAPLRAIDYYSKALAAENHEQLDAEGKRRCEYVRTETKRMGQLIDDLLAFARLGRAALRTVTVDMEQLAADVFEDVARDEDRTRLEFQLGALPPALGDPSILRQVWVNLLSNAVKYSGKKERALVTVEGERIQDVVKYRVRDNGAGFDMNYAKKLFGVFQRLHTEEEFTGTGIGLAIVQRIVQRHGGGIEAESAVDAGATFTFTLPSA
jgi:light-regulated signal transduction histidine kinase (bacteriophytochrome)